MSAAEVVAVVVAVVAVIPATLAAVFAYRVQKASSSVESKKVDQLAYDRAVKIWQDGITSAEKRIDALEHDLELVTSQRDRLSIEVQKLRDLVNQMRGALQAAGVSIPGNGDGH